MKKFKNLSPKESRGLDVIVYKNALQLKKDAQLIAKERKSYASATSLLILSTEEVIKSCLIKLHIENYAIYKLKEANKFFFDHKIRHQLAQFIETGTGMYESTMKYEKQKSKPLLQTKSKWLNSCINEVVAILDASEPLVNAIQRIKALQDFNTLKNKGFYVDYKDRAIIPQEEVSEDNYKETLLIANRIFSFSKLLRLLFHEKAVNHIRKEEIERNKDLLKSFIDDAMPDISFKELKDSKSKGIQDNS